MPVNLSVFFKIFGNLPRKPGTGGTDGVNTWYLSLMVAVAGEIGVRTVFGVNSAGWRSRGREMHAEATREIERKGEKTTIFR